MNVGILGSGDVGKALAGGFLKHGHAVFVGTRGFSIEPFVVAHDGKTLTVGQLNGSVVEISETA